MKTTEVYQGLLAVPHVEPVTLVGSEVSETLPAPVRDAFAGIISQKLETYARVMGQASAQELRASMDEGQFALVLSGNALLSCAQEIGPLTDPDMHNLPEGTMTVGTWLQFGGYGKRAINAVADLAASRLTVPAVVALVGKSNSHAYEALKKAGGVPVGSRQSERVKGAQVTVFQLRPK